MFQEKMVAGEAFNLVILVDGVPSGMIDLHELNQSSGEVGYWLSGDVQHGSFSFAFRSLAAAKNKENRRGAVFFVQKGYWD